MDTGANTGWADVAYGREPGGSGGNEQSNQYEWDEENRLIFARVNGNEIDFLYNAGGERTAKRGKDGEVINYDKMFQVKTNVSSLHITKLIFLGSTRVVSKLSHEIGPIDLEYEKRNAYYYHGDHQGSSNYVTDYEGNEYEHYEYTPYGEMWVEEESDSLDKINFKFTSKELDEETGLYYFGARYLDARASRWLSCDPALMDGTYLDSNAGLGGVFNPVNLSLYHYTGNNPLKYTDPDGKAIFLGTMEMILPRPLIGPLPNLGTIPRLGPMPVLPGEVLPPIIMPTDMLPESSIPQGEAIPKINDIDWNDPPVSPDELGNDWEEITDPRNKSGNREFKNKKSGERIRWDKGKKMGKQEDQKPHWHRKNPEGKNDKDLYLDKNGNPTPKNSKPSHIYPKQPSIFQKFNNWLREKIKKPKNNYYSRPPIV